MVARRDGRVVGTYFRTSEIGGWGGLIGAGGRLVGVDPFTFSLSMEWLVSIDLLKGIDKRVLVDIFICCWM